MATVQVRFTPTGGKTKTKDVNVGKDGAALKVILDRAGFKADSMNISVGDVLVEDLGVNVAPGTVVTLTERVQGS